MGKGGENSPRAAVGSGRLFVEMLAWKWGGLQVRAQWGGMARAVLGLPQRSCKADPYLLTCFERLSCKGHCLQGCAISNWAFNQPNCCLASQSGGPEGLLNTGVCAGETPACAPAHTRCLLPACIPPHPPSPKNMHPFAGQTPTLCVRLLPLHAHVPALPKRSTMKAYQIGVVWKGLNLAAHRSWDLFPTCAMVCSALAPSQQRRWVPTSPITATYFSAFSLANAKISEIHPAQGGCLQCGLIPAPFPVNRDQVKSQNWRFRRDQSHTGMDTSFRAPPLQRVPRCPAHIETPTVEMIPKALGDGSEPTLSMLLTHLRKLALCRATEAKVAGSSVKSRPATVQAHETGSKMLCEGCLAPCLLCAEP